MSDPIRYAIVGAGWISQAAFMPGIPNTSNSVMTALITGDPEKAKSLGETYGIDHAFHYDAWPAAIASGLFDAVYLALPNWQHRQFAVPALEAGLHVLLEKPMATTVEDCEAIEAAATRGNARLMIAYRLHFEPATLDAIRRVHANEIGRATLFTSTFTQQVDPANHRSRNGFWAGPVADMGPYPINAVRNLFAAEPTRVLAHGTSARGLGFHDTVGVTLEFPGDRLAQFTVAYGLSSVSEYRIVGTKGDLTMNPGFAFPAPLAHRLTVNGKTTSHAFPATDQFGAEADYFSDCIRNGRIPEPDGEEGRLDVRVIAAIERALETGKPQDLAPMVRGKRPDTAQVRTLPTIKPPKLVNAAEPANG